MNITEALKLREWLLKRGISEAAVIECLKYISDKNEIKPFRVVSDRDND